MDPAAAWTLQTRTPIRLGPGDAIVVDPSVEAPPRGTLPASVRSLLLPERWLRQWLAQPAVLVRRRIAASSPLGAALAAVLSQAAPAGADGTPLPTGMVATQVGTLLGLIAGGLAPGRGIPSTAHDRLRARFHELLAERCAEPGLTATLVAGALGVSTRTLHRVLASAHETFGESLVAARADAAIRLLRSAAAKRLTIAEIGRRAGFSDASHLARVVRARCGLLPSQLRDPRTR